MPAQDVEDRDFENLPVAPPGNQEQTDKIVAIAIEDLVEDWRKLKKLLLAYGKESAQIVLNLRPKERADQDVVSEAEGIAQRILHAPTHDKAAANHQVIVAQQINHLGDHGRIMVEVGIHDHKRLPMRYL